MDAGRVRQHDDFLILRRPAGTVSPITRLQGAYTQWEDGRWRVDLPGYPPFFGNIHDGNSQLVVALLSLQLPAEPVTSSHGCMSRS